MSSEEPKRVEKITGQVRKGAYAQGSKSQRDAVFLETAKQRYILRRKSGPVFGDSELEQYVGARVECDGFIVGTTLLAENIEVVG